MWRFQYDYRMNTVAKSAPLGTLGLPVGDHLVRFHVEADVISFEIADSEPTMKKPPTGFVRRWGGSVRKIEDAGDAWLTHINDKHLR